jgi:TusA-related sulfurtransferase
MSTAVIARRLDERGKVCPDPTFDTRMTLNEMASGEVLEVVSDYYPTKQTIPMLMAELGYPCKLIDADKPVFRFIIQKL